MSIDIEFIERLKQLDARLRSLERIELPVAGSGGFAPSNAQYLTLATSTGLSNERVFTPVLPLSGLDGGAGAAYTLSIVSAALTRVNDTNVTLTLGGTPASALLAATSITVGWSGLLGLARGGTNADLSATGGAGQYLKQSSAGGAVSVGTIPASEIVSGAALTSADDTNVTLTLGGTPASALLSATSLTLGWTGTLSTARGGTGAASLAAATIVTAALTADRIPYASGATTLVDTANLQWLSATNRMLVTGQGYFGRSAAVNVNFELAGRYDQNATTSIAVVNQIALGNTSAAAIVSAFSVDSSGSTGAYPSDYTTARLQDMYAIVANSTAAGIVISAVSSGQVVNCYIGGTALTHKFLLTGFEVHGQTLGSSVLHYDSVATNDDPTVDVYQGRVATTSATVTTLHTISIASATSYHIVAYVLARRTGGVAGTANDSASYIIAATVKDVSGTATLVGTVTPIHTAEDQSGWAATIDVTGATARVRVTGATDNNITWHLVKLEVSPLSS